MYREACEGSCIIKGIIHPLNLERLTEPSEWFNGMSHSCKTTIVIIRNTFGGIKYER